MLNLNNYCAVTKQTARQRYSARDFCIKTLWEKPIRMKNKRLWTCQQFEQRVNEYLNNGKLGGGTPEGRKIVALYMAAQDMSDHYEAKLNTSRIIKTEEWSADE